MRMRSRGWRSIARVGGAAGDQRADHDGEVLAMHVARGELLDQRGVRRQRARDDHDARGVLVEAMHDAGARQRGQRRVAMEQRIHQRAVGIAGARMHDQAGGLVEDEHRVVLVQDVERDVLGGGGGLDVQDHDQRDGLAAAHRIAPAHQLPSSRASPDLIHSERRERENSGNNSASTASKRRPAALSGTVAKRGSASGDVSLMGSSSGVLMRKSGSGAVPNVGPGRLWRAGIIRASRPKRPSPGFPSMTHRSMTLRPLLLMLIALVLATSGCSKFSKLWKDENKNEGQPVEALYDKAHGYMREARWASATETFQRLIAQYPYGAYTEQALMEMAYAEFKSGKHDDAISTIDRFIRTYPTHRNIAYFYYLRGLSNSTRNTVFLRRSST
jgi:hypothetical protein